MERLSSWRGLRMGRDTVHRVLVWSTVYAPCFWLRRPEEGLEKLGLVGE